MTHIVHNHEADKVAGWYKNNSSGEGSSSYGGIGFENETVKDRFITRLHEWQDRYGHPRSELPHIWTARCILRAAREDAEFIWEASVKAKASRAEIEQVVRDMVAAGVFHGNKK